MLKLNRMTDYAIVVLGVLAHRQGEVLATAQLAELSGLNQPTVAKVAKLLQSSGLLETRRGASGGYQLHAAPETISLVTIIESVEGPIAVNGCVDGAQDPCSVINCCFMSGHWNKVNVTLRNALQAISLADLIDPSQLFTGKKNDLSDIAAPPTNPDHSSDHNSSLSVTVR
ncbi:SUF system Fe-S cluster assembly regulator [Alphaproteobacteria bacterium]|nr:SUF system Fe-S cluster assembly regulator [Alphaproteobacteria bacterium]